MSPITLHGASLYFSGHELQSGDGAFDEWVRALATPTLSRQDLLERAERFESSQPSYAADLRAVARQSH